MSARRLRGRTVYALVPAKAFERAKSRLAPALEPEARARLARSMLTHVVSTLVASPELAGVLVTTDCRKVAADAEALGASVLLDVGPGPLGAVVDRATSALAAKGADAVMIVMGDLPLLEHDDVAEVLDLFGEHDAVLCPDERGRNTNLLAWSTRDAIASSFGHGDSFRRHLDHVRETGLRVAIHTSHGVSFDVDVPGDLARLDARSRPLVTSTAPSEALSATGTGDARRG